MQNAIAEGSLFLVYTALVVVLAVTLIAAFTIRKTDENVGFETRKLRFAAATFTGIMVLFIFVSILYFVDDKAGKEIFETLFTGLLPIAGGIVGYYFAASGKEELPPPGSGGPPPSAGAAGATGKKIAARGKKNSP